MVLDVAGSSPVTHPTSILDCGFWIWCKGMSRWQKLIERILSGSSDSSIAFDDLCNLLERLGFEKRTRGSHNVFRRNGIIERPNLQRSGSNAKPYQVKQVREIILQYGLSDEA